MALIVANSVSVECELGPPLPCIYMCSRPCLTGSPETPSEHARLRNERASPNQRAGPNAASETASETANLAVGPNVCWLIGLLTLAADSI